MAAPPTANAVISAVGVLVSELFQNATATRVIPTVATPPPASRSSSPLLRRCAQCRHERQPERNVGVLWPLRPDQVAVHHCHVAVHHRRGEVAALDIGISNEDVEIIVWV